MNEKNIPTFEYETMTNSTPLNSETLTKLFGGIGWELVNFTHSPSDGYVYVFKRGNMPIDKLTVRMIAKMNTETTDSLVKEIAEQLAKTSRIGA